MMKRLFDLVLSIVLLAVCAPIIGFVAWRIRREDGGTVFYRGERVGKDERLFRMFKFRSMVVDADKKGPSSSADDDPRITQCGKWIRRYKLDEMAQLFNVFLGDMSFVGPRPQVAWAVKTYSLEDRAVLSMRPGITDLASIRFHNEGEILAGSTDPDKTYMELIHPEKMRLAREYVRDHSLWLDSKILYWTLAQLWKTRS